MEARGILKSSLESLLRSCKKYNVDFNELLGEFTKDKVKILHGPKIERLNIEPKLTIYRRI